MLRRTSIILCALLMGCRVYNYELGAQDSSGGVGGTSAATSSSSGTGALSSMGGASAEGTSGGTSRGGASGVGGSMSVTPGLIGWASVSECGPRGTTGGQEGPTIRPTTAEELDDAVRATGPSVIEISGTIELGSVILQISGDKTLVGVNGAELVGSVRVLNARNVMMKNIRFNGGGIPSNLTSIA